MKKVEFIISFHLYTIKPLQIYIYYIKNSQAYFKYIFYIDEIILKN